MQLRRLVLLYHSPNICIQVGELVMLYYSFTGISIQGGVVVVVIAQGRPTIAIHSVAALLKF